MRGDRQPWAGVSIITTSAGDRPAARKASGGRSDVQQQLKAVVTIESVDVPAQVVVYVAGDNRRVMRTVVDPHLLEGLKKGDVVELTYTRERAIELQKQP